MNLLDAASTHVTIGGGRWTSGWDASNRVCGTHVFLDDHCGDDPDGGTVIGGPDGTVEPYSVRSFGIIAELPTGAGCRQDDDEDYIAALLTAASEQAIGRAICVEHAAGSDTWIGSAGVRSVPEGEYAAGRAEWFSVSVGTPTLHVSADLLPALVGEGVTVDGPTTVWGDQIVSSPGYPEGTAFWAGRIDVYMTAVSTATLVAALRNLSVVQATMVAAIDIAPCTVVRIGG